MAAAGSPLSGALGTLTSSALDAALDEWIEDAAYVLAQAFLNTAAVVEYEVAILDGALPSLLLERLVEATRRHLATVPSLTASRPSLERGHIGAPGAALGAAQLLLYRRFFSRELEHIGS
jgi:predicted NBD/HSP70 family sugar kinase